MDQISDKQEKSLEREDWESKRIVEIIEQSRTVEVKNLIDIFECPICMELLETVDVYGVAIRLPFCSHAHYFHTQCAKQMLMTSGKCAICSHLYIVKQGNQPISGTMRVIRGPPSLAGYKELGIGTIIINYNFPNGVQTEIMPCPGQQYYGTNRTAYLPDTLQGNKILRLLQRCFDIRQTFQVGTSVTTGMPNCVVWNGVHHKVRKVLS